MTLPTMTGIRTPFVRYDELGQIIAWGHQDSGVIAYQRDELRQPVMEAADEVLDGLGERAFYVLGGEIVPREECPAVLKGKTISKLPKPSWLDVKNAEGPDPISTYEVTDGKAELEFEFAGTYRVTVRSVRHLSKIFEVTA